MSKLITIDLSSVIKNIEKEITFPEGKYGAREKAIRDYLKESCQTKSSTAEAVMGKILDKAKRHINDFKVVTFNPKNNKAILYLV